MLICTPLIIRSATGMALGRNCDSLKFDEGEKIKCLTKICIFPWVYKQLTNGHYFPGDECPEAVC